MPTELTIRGVYLTALELLCWAVLLIAMAGR